MKTKKRTTRRKMLSVMLTLVLLITMLPLSGGQVAKALVSDAYPGLVYIIKTDSEGSEYVSLSKSTGSLEKYVDATGTLTLPSEIDGKPVKEVSGTVTLGAGTRAILPASVDTITAKGCLSLKGIEELLIMCEGEFTVSACSWGLIYFESNQNKLKDIYFYSSDIDTPANLIDLTDSWGTDPALITLHVASQTVYDKFNADTKVQENVSAGRLAVVKDDISENPTIKIKRESLVEKISIGGGMVEGDYTKASWTVLQSALDNARKYTNSSDEGELDAAIATLDEAFANMVPLAPIKEAIATVNAQMAELKEEDYKPDSWKAVQDAIAAAEAVPDDATKEKVAELAKAVTDAYKGLWRKIKGAVTISWGKSGDSGPVVPPINMIRNGSSYLGSSGIQYWYYKDEACTVPAVGQDATTKPTAPGEYYLRVTSSATETHTASVSNVLKFTITEREVNWNGYQWDESTGELTITEDMVDFPNAMEVPWYDYRDKITAVKVKEGVVLTRIGAYAFSDASSLQDFQIPSTVKAVGDYAFASCGKLENVIALTDITAGKCAFYRCMKLQGTVTLADTMTEIPESCFEYCPLSGITIPTGVTTIGARAFMNSKNFEGADLVLPATVTMIGASAFEESGIASIILPDNLKSIGESAFAGNTSLQQIVIPASVQTIGGGLFYRCSSLYYVEFIGTGYNTETLLSKTTIIGGETYDWMFHGTSPDLAVLCDGTTYETLAGYAGVIGGDKGWPSTVLHTSQEYLADILEGYQTDKAAASALKREDYGEATWNSLQAAIAEAEAMLVDGSNNYEVSSSRLAARKRIAEGVMPCLQEILGSTKTYLAGDNIEKDYDTESDSWWDLQDAIEDAERILNENTADVTEIIKRIQILQTAKNALAPRATDTAKAALDTAIATLTKDLQESDYTPDSWKTLQDALAEAEAIKTTGTISQIEAAQKKIENAAKALVKKNPGTSTKPTTDPNGGTSTKPTTDPGSNGGTSTKPTTAPGSNGSANVQPTQKPGGNVETKKVTVKKATIKKAKSTKKKTITVQWKKLSGITGYQVQLGTNKKITKGKKTYTVKKAKTTKKTIKKLKSKKKYYVRVRAYKTQNSKKHYGKWSKIKTVKVK